MRWDIVHQTQYRYASPVRESYNEVRLQPMTTAGQTVESFALKIVPAARLKHYHDFYANVVHHFEIAEPHDGLVIESTVQAYTMPPAPAGDKNIPYPLRPLSEATHSFRCFEFLNASR